MISIRTGFVSLDATVCVRAQIINLIYLETLDKFLV